MQWCEWRNGGNRNTNKRMKILREIVVKYREIIIKSTIWYWFPLHLSYSILSYAFLFYSFLIPHFLINLSPRFTFPSPPLSSTFLSSSLLISFCFLPLLFSIAFNISSQALGTIPRMSSPPLSYRIFKDRWGSSNVLYRTIIHNHTLHCTALHYTILYYTIQHSPNLFLFVNIWHCSPV